MQDCYQLSTTANRDSICSPKWALVSRGTYVQAESWWRARPIVAFFVLLTLLLLAAHLPILFSF